MTRINTNVTALISTRILGRNSDNLSKTLERLSTGYRINRGADDPAGLIASENLRADLAATRSAISNSERAQSVVATAEGSLAEISDLLIRLQELTSQAANAGGMTDEEIDANQTQVDGIIASINRIASETSFEGMRLLDGSKSIIASATGGTANTTDVEVRGFKQVGTSNRTLNIALTASATVASADTTTAVGATAETWEITGALGTAVFTFQSASLLDISAAINAMSSVTGVKVSGDALVSVKYGADQFIRVRNVSGGTTALTAGSGTDGTDASIAIDGVAATVNGYDVTLKTETLDIKFRITDDVAGGTTAAEVITILGGTGATFQLSPNIGLVGKEGIGIPSVSSYHLGVQEYGFISDIARGQLCDLDTDPDTAQRIVDAAIKQVSTLRGRLGSFLNDTVRTNINSLQIAGENLAASESLIRDTDFASETAAMTRNQILVSTANSVLAIANATPQAVLSLLR